MIGWSRALRAGALAGGLFWVCGTIPVQAIENLEFVVQCDLRDERLVEISGITSSLRHQDLLWVHNDSSDDARIYGINTDSCQTVAEVVLAGVQARDIEGMAATSIGGSPVLWIADIGDNRDSWSDVGVYRIREPKNLGESRRRAREYRFTYDDRPHNAETIMARGERLWVATWQLASGGMYTVFDPPRRGVATAQRVGGVGSLITDGAIAPDASGYILRDYLDVHFFQGLPPGRKIATLALPRQPQGEAITWSRDGRSLWTASESDTRLIRIDVPWWVRAAMRPPDHLVD